MGVVRICGGAALRGRWWGTVGVVLLVALAGGLVLAAAAGARRTATAYDRLASSTHAADAFIGPNGFGFVDPAVVASLPGVAVAAPISGYGIADRPREGLVPPGDDFAGVTAIASGDGRAGYSIDRMRLLDGRPPRRDRAHEVAVNEAFARSHGLGVGDRYDAVLYTFSDLQALGQVLDAEGRDPTDAEARAVFRPVRFRISGVGRLRGDVDSVGDAVQPTLFLTPAFVRSHPDLASFGGVFVRLRDPARDVARLGSGARRRITGLSVDVQSLQADQRAFARSVTPYVTALWLFAAVALVAGLLVVGQSLVRLVSRDAAVGPTLSALGASRAQRTVAAGVRAALVVAVGGLLAAALAVAASAAFPLGRAAEAEPHPGLAVDPLVVGGGLLGMVLALEVVVSVSAWWRSGRRSVAVVRPSRTAEALARRGSPAAVVCGVRSAFQRRPGPDGLSLATTVVGLVAAIATLGGAIVFASNLDHLVSTPAAYGWNWDALVDTFDVGIQPDFADEIAAERDFTALTEGTRATFVIDGHSVPAFGFTAIRGDAGPAVSEGRAPTRPDEVALGGQTLATLGAAVGDRVVVTASDGTRHRLEVVGRTAVPSLNLNGTYGVGEGAAMTTAGLTAIDPSAQPSFYLANLRDGASVGPLQRRHGAAAQVVALKEPEDIQSYRRVRTTPFLLAGLLALLGVGVLVHVLVTSIRDRRAELALLKTLGFVRRQVAATVAWQATALVGAAVAVGIPIALLLGVSTWRRFAAGLGVATAVAVPVVGLLVLVVVALVVANLIALVPARAAARVRPAVVLRSE